MSLKVSIPGFGTTEIGLGTSPRPMPHVGATTERTLPASASPREESFLITLERSLHQGESFGCAGVTVRGEVGGPEGVRIVASCIWDAATCEKAQHREIAGRTEPGVPRTFAEAWVEGVRLRLIEEPALRSGTLELTRGSWNALGSSPRRVRRLGWLCADYWVRPVPLDTMHIWLAGALPRSDEKVRLSQFGGGRQASLMAAADSMSTTGVVRPESHA